LRLGAGLRALALACAGWGAAFPGNTAALRVCDPPAPLSAAQKDKLFRFGDIIKQELEQSGQRLALISRSGLDLARFGMRYSHAGLSLKASANAPWSVRQLYYACDEQKPRVYDQGIAGFLLGLDDPSAGYVSVVLMPQAAADALERAVLDDRQAVQLLAAHYSANAYPFSLNYQNCNQWVMEVLAAAWGDFQSPYDLRQQAQDWLRQQGYEPAVFDVGRPLMWLAALVPWLRSDDHPASDLAQQRFHVSMPESIEAFVQARWPGASRVEFCHTEDRVVVRRGWSTIATGCQAAASDTVLTLD
jgi:hypothetical protein